MKKTAILAEAVQSCLIGELLFLCGLAGPHDGYEVPCWLQTHYRHNASYWFCTALSACCLIWTLHRTIGTKSHIGFASILLAQLPIKSKPAPSRYGG